MCKGRGKQLVSVHRQMLARRLHKLKGKEGFGRERDND
jgi:hypothetical protein